jgi:hypothetical protein
MEMSESRIQGGICLKHPELEGQRYRRNGGCPGCQADRVKKRRARPEQKAAANEKRAHQRKMQRQAYKDNKQILELVRIAGSEIAVKAGKHPSHWREHWADAVKHINTELGSEVICGMLADPEGWRYAGQVPMYWNGGVMDLKWEDLTAEQRFAYRARHGEMASK